ncbi:hypothetical protein ODJ79_21665 [Actinoplanes sp. KI2]|uniref:hypothetical protein n=1 Tax=Actinoplanes sp. KI2 TaxID=2983315 RepID=UPI0021D5C723|nr:hypothetical protein [Actinoplanes sp. KI2]MCU7726345.1 hypothetical protein [Actinoplanes sp. KI2]
MTGRRTVLLLGAASVLAACGRDDVPAMMKPLPVPSSAPPPVARLRSVADWANVFQQSWDYQLQSGLPLSRSADSWDHYDLSYSVDSCVAMFRATGEGRYVDRALQFVENVAAAAAPSASLPHSSFHDRYLGWASEKNGEDGDEVPLYESYFWRYGTGLLVTMRDAGLTGDRYRRLLDFAEVQVFEKWYSRGPQDTVYRDVTHLSAHWALIALNLAQVTTDAARRARYLAVAGDFDQRMRRQLRRNPVEPTAYFWDDTWGRAKRPGQDVSHGNGVMAYVTEARARGNAWTDADMTAFSSLLTRVIWPGGTTYRGYLDGSGSDNGWFSDGFVKLGRYDPATQLRLDSHRVVNDQFAGNMALNARILRRGGR